MVIETSMSNYHVYFEGTLGLGPKYGNSSTGSGNLVTNMYSQGLIPRNVFSMIIPHMEGDPGELIFGGTNGDVDLDDVVMVPVTNATGSGWNPDVLTNAWQVSAGHVKLGSGIVLNRTLDGYTAFIEAEFPYIGLPSDVVDQMHVYMGAYRLGWSWIFALDCDGREKLSDLVFNLGGQEFRMSPFDYTEEYENDGQKRCISMFIDIDSREGDKVPTIALGMGFLRGFQTVFDLERNMIGCEF